MTDNPPHDRLRTLRRRVEFLALRRAPRVDKRAFSLLAARRTGIQRGGDDSRAPRFGFTVTRKTGNSVERSRIRRRLKEAVRVRGQDHALQGHDYVLIGRRAALSERFSDICGQLDDAISSVNQRVGRRESFHRKGNRAGA